MEMIIAELHEQSRQLTKRAHIVLFAAMRLAGESQPMLSPDDRAAADALATADDVIKEARAVRRDATAFKGAVWNNRLEYPTPAAFERRMYRASEATHLAIRAHAHMTKLAEGESSLYRAQMSEVVAFRLEADAHMDRADELDGANAG